MSSNEPNERDIRASRAFSRKLGLVVAGVVSFVVGAAALWWTLRSSGPSAIAAWPIVRWIIQRLPEDVRRSGEAVRVICAMVVVMVVWLVAMIAAFTWASRFAREKGDRSWWTKLLVAPTRNSVGAGWAILIAGVLLAGTLTYAVIHYSEILLYLRWAPLVLGTSFLIVCIGLATLFELPLVLNPLRPLAEPAVSVPAPSVARATGQELMNRLRESPVFRRQIHCDVMLDERKFGYSVDGRRLLRERFPRLEAVLPTIGINVLSSDQTAAMAAIAANEKKNLGRDMVFIGRPGSGRTTMANLIALGVALQNEGSVHCVTPDSPAQYSDRGDEPSMLRHPSVQMRMWLARAQLQESVLMQTSFQYDAQPLDLGVSPHIIYTDVRMLSQSVLTRVRGDARRLLSRLKYVIIDQPDRLSREDLVRLRLALCRLRMTGELLGTPIRFIVILPRLNNAVEVAKYLVNRADIEAIAFGSWVGRCNMVGWVPPLEVAERDDTAPRFVRASFIDESVALMTELGFQANQLERPLRIAVVDSKPLFGPEARDLVRERVRDAIAAETRDADSFEVRAKWEYFAQTELGGDHDHEFDVIVSLGIGRYPREIVSSLRPAVAAEGALILVADSSPDDIESLQVISSRGWSPEREDELRRFPTLLLPDHSDAVLAHELSALFEDFAERPVPHARLLEIFPGEGVADLLTQWQSSGPTGENRPKIRAVMTYGDLHASERWPKMLRCFKRNDDTFTSEEYEIPWGCCSREIYKIYDITANREHVAGQFLNDAVDWDRIFIDFHPQTILRYAPNTLLVRQKRDYSDSGTADLKLPGRYKELGRLEVETLSRDDSIRIDRRVARMRTRILSERSPDATATAGVTAISDPLAAFLHVQGSDGSRNAVLDCITRRDLSARARLRIAAGEWSCKIEETLRDVVRTTDRLVEEPDYSMPVRTGSDLGAPLQRTLESVALSLFLEPHGDWTKADDSPDPLNDYASHYALARAMERFLRRDFLHFETEFRVSVVPAGSERFRILIYRVRNHELGWNHTLSAVLEPEDLQAIFESIHQRLETCDCDDGCSICCGTLGTIPRSLLPRHDYEPEDAISRSGAYQLVCGILGRVVDWEQFARGRVDRYGPAEGLSDTQLSRLVAEIIGTTAANHTDGLWTKLFGGSMRFTPEIVARAEWMDSETNEAHPTYAGFYSTSDNRVVVRPHHDLTYVKEVIVHEFAHNWQFRAGVFDLDTHYHRDEMKPYFAGTLIIEGHAVWCEQLYRVHHRLGASYTTADGRPWNEYKVGYLLMEGIEKAVGQNGLFVWLCRGEKPRDIRSQDRRFQWPFTLDEALRNLDLHRFVRPEPFTGFDVGMTSSTSTSSTSTSTSTPTPTSS